MFSEKDFKQTNWPPEIRLFQFSNRFSEIDQSPFGGDVEHAKRPRDEQAFTLRRENAFAVVHQNQVSAESANQFDGGSFTAINVCKGSIGFTGWHVAYFQPSWSRGDPMPDRFRSSLRHEFSRHLLGRMTLSNNMGRRSIRRIKMR